MGSPERRPLCWTAARGAGGRRQGLGADGWMLWALGSSPLMGSRGRFWKWLSTMPSGWWTGEEAGRLAGRLSQPVGQVSPGSLFLSGAHPLELWFGFAPGGLWRGLVSPGTPPLPPSVVSSGGGLAGRGASQDLSHSVGHFSLRLPVAGSGTIILVHDLAVGPAPDSLRPQILLPHLHPRPAPELLGHPPWACAGGTPLVLGWPGESVPLEDTWVRVLAHPWDCGKSLPPPGK